jgi:hypothetical protein
MLRLIAIAQGRVQVRTLTVVHVAISLIGILSGFVVMLGMLARKRLDRWTGVFLITTVATSVTGFFLPFDAVTPAIGVAIISIIVLAVAYVARYVRRMAGAWRWVFVVSAGLALYFNAFVLVVQLFQKAPALKALAPTQDLVCRRCAFPRLRSQLTRHD